MQTIEQSREMAKLACEALADKKGEDIRVIDIAGISVLADYFIIANGTNESQVRALVDNVEETLGKAGYEVKQREGYGLGNWVLLDFGDICLVLERIRSSRCSQAMDAKPFYMNTGGFGIAPYG